MWPRSWLPPAPCGAGVIMQPLRYKHGFGCNAESGSSTSLRRIMNYLQFLFKIIIKIKFVKKHLGVVRSCVLSPAFLDSTISTPILWHIAIDRGDSKCHALPSALHAYPFPVRCPCEERESSPRFVWSTDGGR